MKKNFKKIIAMGLTAIMAVSAMSISAFAAEVPERKMSPNATVKTITYDDGSSITVHANEGFTIDIEDCDDEIAPLSAILTMAMKPNYNSSTVNTFTLDGTDVCRDTFNTATADVLFSPRNYKLSTSTLTAAVKTNSVQTIDVDVIQYNPATNSNKFVGYVTFNNYKGTKNLRASNISSSCRYYFKVTKTDGDSGTGYIDIA